MREPDSGLVKSAARALRLFEGFSAAQRPLSVMEIATELTIPQPSATMLIKSFVAMGYLDRVPGTRLYYPTLRIMMLGAWMYRAHAGAAQLPGMIENISRQTGETVVLAMRNGIYSQYVLTYVGSGRAPLIVESGMMYPLACCSTGWCLLAEMDDASIDKIVRRTQLEVPPRYWRKSAEDAYEKIAEFRAQGYIASNGQTEPGLGAVAIRLQSSDSAFGLSAAIGGPSDRIARKMDSILGHLRTLADQYGLISDRPHFEDGSSPFKSMG